MRNWKNVVLSDVLQEKGYIRGPFGSALKRGELLSKGIPVYEQQHAINDSRDFRFFIDEKKFEEMKRFQVEENDLIISCSGTVGKVSIITSSDPKGIISQALLLLRVNRYLIEPLYLKYFFSSQEGYNAIVSRSSGSVQVNISRRSVIENIPLSLPPLDIQKKIVGVLSVIDHKIDINNVINKNLEQQAQALYQHMFIDSPCAEWREGTLSDIAEVSSGKRPPMKSTVRTNETAFPIVGAADVMGFTDSFNHNDKILIIGRVGTHGIVQRFNSPCWTSDNTLVITSNYYEYVYQILKRIDYHSLNRGSTQPLITQSDINKVPVLLPDNDALIEYETLAGTLMSEHEANVIENTKLSEIRDTLLPRLMSGEIDVSDIDI